MVHTRAQRRVEAAAEHSMTGGSATLPDELLLRVLEHVMLRRGEKEWRGGVRRVSRTWRALHDGACTRLRLSNGVTDEVMHALCGRLPALKTLYLGGVTSLTADGLFAVGGLTALTYLRLSFCNVTDAVLRELRGLTELSTLYLYDCALVTDVGVRELRDLTALTHLVLSRCFHVTDAGLRELRDLTALRTLDLYDCTVTDAGLQHLMSLTALSELHLRNNSTTQAGRNALKAALPALTIHLHF
jgi:Leucine-rich repeat (LRR) protein